MRTTRDRAAGLVEPPTGSSGQTSGNAAIEAVGLSKVFGDFTAVDNLDLTIERGELFSLLGPNGAGKTTTIKMLCCLLRPSAGAATIMGHDIGHDTLAVKQLLAISPQETAIAEHLNAWENLSLMARLHGLGARETEEKSAELLGLMALTDRADEQAGKYSGGMKRRLSIAMALVSEPRVLFLDEPTIGLDPQSRRGMWEHISSLKGSTTIVLTTHYLEEADALADRIAVIDEGRLIALGTPQELKAHIGGTALMFVEATNVTEDAVEALRSIYPVVRAVDGGIEIEADDVSVYDIGDCLRPFGVAISSTHRREVTLDDVFIELTGKELRQ